RSPWCPPSAACSRRCRSRSCGCTPPRWIVLWMSSDDAVGLEGVVDLSGNGSFEGSAGVAGAVAAGVGFVAVGAGGGVVAESADGDHVEGGVRFPVAASVQAHAGGFAG